MGNPPSLRDSKGQKIRFSSGAGANKNLPRRAGCGKSNHFTYLIPICIIGYSISIIALFISIWRAYTAKQSKDTYQASNLQLLLNRLHEDDIKQAMQEWLEFNCRIESKVSQEMERNQEKHYIKKDTRKIIEDMINQGYAFTPYPLFDFYKDVYIIYKEGGISKTGLLALCSSNLCKSVLIYAPFTLRLLSNNIGNYSQSFKELSKIKGIVPY